MKKVRAKFGIGLLFSALVLTTGCGEKAIQLTEEEEGLIVDYTAHVVSKFNTRQPDGLVYVHVTEEESEEPVATEQEEETEETAQELTAEGAEEAAGQETDAEQPVSMTLTQALGLAGVDAQVTATELKSSYEEGGYYVMDASAGKTFLVLHIALNNQTTEDINCDLLSGQPQFGAVINGMGAVPAELTVLLNDLSTYQGTLAAGSSTDTVLLFQVPADSVAQVDTLTLNLTWNGNRYEIPCLETEWMENGFREKNGAE